MRPALRFGLVGAGPWGRNYLRAIAGLEGIALGWVASRNPETAGLVPAGCRVTPDWRELVGAPGLDAVIVAAPPAAHAEIALESIRAGRPVLVEKPMTLTPASAQDVVAAARERGVYVMVDHVHLFHSAFRDLKRATRARGPVRRLATSAGNRGPYRPEVPVLWDWGPHDVAMCIDLLGREPDAANARRLEARPIGGAVAERLRLELRFPGEVSAGIVLSTLDARHRRFAAEFDDGSLVYDPDAAPAATPPLECALREFADAVRGGSRSLDSAMLGARVVQTLAQCDASLAAQA